jgi:hypothetical protein
MVISDLQGLPRPSAPKPGLGLSLGGLGLTRTWTQALVHGLGWAGLRLKPGLQSDDKYIDIARQ